MEQFTIEFNDFIHKFKREKFKLIRLCHAICTNDYTCDLRTFNKRLKVKGFIYLFWFENMKVNESFIKCCLFSVLL